MTFRPGTQRPDSSSPSPGWDHAHDYLADPAVAPLRALLGAVARRLRNRRRGGRPQERRPDARPMSAARA